MDCLRNSFIRILRIHVHHLVKLWIEMCLYRTVTGISETNVPYYKIGGRLHLVQLVLCDRLTDTQTDFIICPMLLTHWADNNVGRPFSMRDFSV